MATSKLPAPVQASRAPAQAGAAKLAAPPSTFSGTGTFKLLVWLLVALNVAAAGGWVYFKFFKNGEAEKNLQVTKKRLVNLQSDLDILQNTVRGIATNGVNEVEDPGKLVSAVAKAVNLTDSLSYGTVNTQKFHRTNYMETIVKVTFLNKKVYKFADIVKFLSLLEAANPTVQIKDVEFGKRYQQIANDGWTPTSATVRTLQIAIQPGS